MSIYGNLSLNNNTMTFDSYMESVNFEINNFNNILESINILNENGIEVINEKFSFKELGNKILKIAKIILKPIIWLLGKIKDLFTNARAKKAEAKVIDLHNEISDLYRENSDLELKLKGTEAANEYLQAALNKSKNDNKQIKSDAESDRQYLVNKAKESENKATESENETKALAKKLSQIMNLMGKNSKLYFDFNEFIKLDKLDLDKSLTWLKSNEIYTNYKNGTDVESVYKTIGETPETLMQNYNIVKNIEKFEHIGSKFSSDYNAFITNKLKTLIKEQEEKTLKSYIGKNIIEVLEDLKTQSKDFANIANQSQSLVNNMKEYISKLTTTIGGMNRFDGISTAKVDNYENFDAPINAVSNLYLTILKTLSLNVSVLEICLAEFNGKLNLIDHLGLIAKSLK